MRVLIEMFHPVVQSKDKAHKDEGIAVLRRALQDTNLSGRTAQFLLRLRANNYVEERLKERDKLPSEPLSVIEDFATGLQEKLS